MGKTRLSVATALLLAGISLAVFVARRAVVGADLDGPPGDSSWKVSLFVSGKLSGPEGSVTFGLPLDFRRQHIFDEHFQSRQLSHRLGKNPEHGGREVVWRQAPMGQVESFRLTYSFRCVLGMRKPTALMNERTEEVDAAPRAGQYSKPAALIESDHPPGTEPFTLATGRPFHEARGVVALQLARPRLLAKVSWAESLRTIGTR
jgi:hypothetical protein